MLAVLGSFRFPAEHLADAEALLRDVVVATRLEDGCLAYALAPDLADPGLINVSELWRDRAAIDAHFATPHMVRFLAERAALGFFDRQIAVYPVGEPTAL